MTSGNAKLLANGSHAVYEQSYNRKLKQTAL